jgi:hypothetical protein
MIDTFFIAFGAERELLLETLRAGQDIFLAALSRVKLKIGGD